MSTRVTAIICMLSAAIACDLPRDPHKTLRHVRGRVLTVGVAEDPPFIVRHGDEPAGVEADIIRGFASHLAAQVKWNWDSQESHLAALHNYQMDLVAGGLRAKTPWKAEVAVTRPFVETLGGEKHVFAVPPGENAFLSDLERYLAAHHEEIARAAAGKP